MPQNLKNKNRFKAFFQYLNLRLILLCALASAYGCILVYSAAHGVGNGWSGVAIQIVASIGGLLLAVLLARVDYEAICALWPVWSGIAIVLVLLTFTSAGLNATGTDDTAWLAIGPVTFQPAELLKISFIISFSLHLSKVQDRIREFRTVFFLCLHGGIHILLVFMQGDDGTALVFIAIFLCMLLVSGVNLLYYVFGLAGVCTVIPILWTFFMSEDKKARFLCIFPAFVEKYLKTEGWQQFQALKCIGTGQLSGVGYLKGTQPDLFARNNDLIFIVAAEEFGFLGGLLLFVLLSVMIVELFLCARRAKDPLGTYLCVGMMAYIGFQSLINLGMNLRLLPVIGITLPFFSDGGSSVATLYLGIALVLSVSYASKMRKGNTL